MKHSCGGLAPPVAIVLLLGLGACGLPAGHPSPTPRPTATATASKADPQRCERLAKRGFTPCPPTADKLPLPPTTIRNATNGAIPDATAQQWGRAFQLTEAYYRWALQANARDALTAGGFADPNQNAITNLFSSDLMDLDNAARQDGELVFVPLNMPLVQLVAVPADLQPAMRRQGLTPTDYGFVVRFTGPGQRSVRRHDGSEIVIVSTPSDYSAALLIWGQLKQDPELGTIWYERGNYGCDGNVRSVCQI
jgi:hypothetical protein